MGSDDKFYFWQSMDSAELAFNKNEDLNRQLWKKYESIAKKIHEGGGAKSQARQKEKGKLLARERIDYLKDDDADFLEIGTFTAHDMYAEHGGCPAGGVVGGITKVSGRTCLVVANDATVKAGAWFPITGKKKSSISGNCHGEQNPHNLPGGFRGCLSSNAG